jgi:hypothetical protein
LYIFIRAIRRYDDEQRLLADEQENNLLISMQRYLDDRVSMLDTAIDSERRDIKTRDKQRVCCSTATFNFVYFNATIPE